MGAVVGAKHTGKVDYENALDFSLSAGWILCPSLVDLLPRKPLLRESRSELSAMARPGAP